MVRIPRSSEVRGRPEWGKLLTRVDPEAKDGFGFEGTFIAPGRYVEESELRATPAHPAIPILLECCLLGKVQSGHRRSPMTYILWRYENRAWHEIARSEGLSWEWAIDLRPIAIRALEAAHGRKSEPSKPDLEATTVRIAEFLDWELAAIEAVHRAQILAALHDVLAARLSNLDGKVSPSVQIHSRTLLTD